MTTTSPSGSTPAEAEAFLAAHPEIEAFDIILHDANGIGRGKIIRRHELLSFYNNGRHLPISILGLDICGEDVHETGLIWDQGDGDLRAFQSEYQNGRPAARILLEARLVESGSLRILASRRFEVSQPASDTTVPAVINAFGQAGDQLAREVLEWTVQQGQAAQQK